MNHTFQSSIPDLVHENIGDKSPILSAQQTFGRLLSETENNKQIEEKTFKILKGLLNKGEWVRDKGF